MADLFELRPESVGTFLGDETVRLPRFQRRSAWTDVQRFDLALSLFKGYPMGTVVVKRESMDAQGVSQPVTFLLDGRQRRETLSQMKDPEAVYSWALKTLKLRANDATDAVITKYQTYINEYFFGLEDWEKEEMSQAAPGLSEEEVDDGAGKDEEPPSLPGLESPTIELDKAPPSTSLPSPGLDDLLNLILLVHPVTKAGRESGFRRLFDFDKHIESLPFIVQDDAGNRFVSSEKLLIWFEFNRQMDKKAPWPPSEENLLDWLCSGRDVLNAEVVKKRLHDDWPQIERSFRLLETLKDQVNNAVLGRLEIRDVSTSNDDKKIFEIINTAGTKLSAAEILSAKAVWDMAVPSPPDLVRTNVKDLKDAMGIEFDGTVRRWDSAATLLDRIQAPLVLGSSDVWSWQGIVSKRLEQKMTLGFKILSGYYKRRLQKDDVASLPATAGVAWDTLTLETRINEVHTILGKYWFFEYFQAWGVALVDSLSDAVGIDYLLRTLYDWENKSEPRGAGAPLNAFRKNAVILLDRLIYEYVNEVWRGSSDSRIARNLDGLRPPKADVLEPIAASDWEKLLNDVVDAGELAERAYTGGLNARVGLLMKYAMVIAHQRPDNAHERIQMDHLIPERLFNESGDKVLEVNRHHISNLQPFPATLNNTKSGRRLNEISEPNVRAAISRFARIREQDFDLFSDVPGSAKLRKARGDLIKSLLIDERVKVVSDPDVHQSPDLWVKP